MQDPRDLNPQAIAGLSLVSGSSSAGLLSELEKYGYTRDGTDHNTWHLGAENASLVFTEDLAEVAIVGESSENVENLNMILSRAGWETVKLISVDKTAEELLLTTLSALNVLDVSRSWAEEPAVQSARHAISQDVTTPHQSSTAEVLDETTTELTKALADLELAQQKSRRLEQDNVRLTNELAQARASALSQSATFPLELLNSPVIFGAIETMLNTEVTALLESKHKDLIGLLKTSGYGINISVTQQ